MEEGKKHKVMIGIEVILLGMIIAIVGTNAASSNPPSNGVSYSKNNQTTVEGALNDLYNKANYGNASAGQILSGKTALVGGKKVTGTLTIPTLTSQTPGDAKPENIDKGKIAWVNGEKIVGMKLPLLGNKLMRGDYVRYTPVKTSYTVLAKDTGYDKDITIHPDNVDIWRVIKVNEDGTVDVVANYSSGAEVGFKKEIGYENYINVLNQVASSYETDGITVGSRHVGYGDLRLIKRAMGFLIVPPKNGSFRSSAYWIASKCGSSGVYYHEFVGQLYEVDFRTTNPDTYKFHTNLVGDSISVDAFYCTSTPNLQGMPNILEGASSDIRPIVVLKSTLKITGGNGTEESPWTLGI